MVIMRKNICKYQKKIGLAILVQRSNLQKKIGIKIALPWSKIKILRLRCFFVDTRILILEQDSVKVMLGSIFGATAFEGLKRGDHC